MIGAALVRAVRAHRGDAACCAACRHFTSDPRVIATALPGLGVLSSAHASVTGDDGLCRKHDRFASARGLCPAFTPSASVA